jgi:hypothetical protein
MTGHPARSERLTIVASKKARVTGISSPER